MDLRLPIALDRTRVGRHALALCLGAFVAGCTDMPTVVSLPAPRPPTGEAAETNGTPHSPGPGWDSSLEGFRNDDRRVADVAYRIATANAALCPDLAPLSGLVLQSALQFSPRLRARARAVFHLGDRPAVEAVAPGGPAAAAGLRLGDVLVSVGDRPLPAPPPEPDTEPATYKPIEEAQATLTRALARGPTAVGVERGSLRIRVVLTPRRGCAYDVQVIPGPGFAASADGRHVFISSALVSYAGADATLALILGHEFAHDLLHHHDRLDRHGLMRSVLGDFGSTPVSLWTAEREADYVGLYLTARAGYDISQAPEFWRRFPSGPDQLSWSHPPARERARDIAATRDEIWSKEKSGAPLRPNGLPLGRGEAPALEAPLSR